MVGWVYIANCWCHAISLLEPREANMLSEMKFGPIWWGTLCASVHSRESIP